MVPLKENYELCSTVAPHCYTCILPSTEYLKKDFYQIYINIRYRNYIKIRKVQYFDIRLALGILFSH